MKNLKIYLCFIVLYLIAPVASYATSAYGTHMPEKHKWSWGLEANSILDRNLDNGEGAASGNRYFINGSFGILGWLSFDGKIGIGDVDWNRLRGQSSLTYDANFAGGYGFRIKGPEAGRLGIKTVAGFQHISVHPGTKDQDGVKNDAIIDEWNGTFIISKNVGRFIPYIGYRYGSLDFIKWVDEAHRKRIHSEKYHGLVIGGDYWVTKSTKFNLEGTFLDGEELSLGISHDF